MKPDQRKKFEIAVYIAIGALAIPIAVLSALYLTGASQEFFLNIAAGFLGVAALFFLVNRFFGLDAENSTLIRLESILAVADKKLNLLCDSKHARERFPLDELVYSANQLDVIGSHLQSFLNEYRGAITEQVQKGAKIRLIIIDPASLARELIYKNSLTNTFDKNIALSLSYVETIQNILSVSDKRIKGKFEFRLINWIPSCSYIIAKTNETSGIIKLSINNPFYRAPKHKERLNIVFERKEQPTWFDFYVEQFENQWANSYEWNGKIPSTRQISKIEAI